MKLIVIAFATFILSGSAIAQTERLEIKTGAQTVSVSLDEDNAEKILIINSHASKLADRVTIFNANKTESKHWKRSFIITNTNDEEMMTFAAATTGSITSISVKNLVSKLKQNQEYSLWTIAIPRDPAKAATVRVRRILVSKIRVK